MRGSYITVFVFNIPMTMHWKGLWTLFSYHRKVVDAFIPEKTSKSRKRFGFIRFSNFLDAKRAITRLNGFVILGSKISVNIARFKVRRSIWRSVVKHKKLLDRNELNQIRVVVGRREKVVEEHMMLRCQTDLKVMVRAEGIRV
ncbi:hypothetical protein PVK06_047257 [Gossypium arboreum]|uniref:RRM domain-containing protein n=1 Tax=Gossypium arboreum TaxID=29729 RepID=A0ABR0MDA1_GOSAR|nr:hypothetical protein PVK06_047257 [Gossypium arboreum]